VWNCEFLANVLEWQHDQQESRVHIVPVIDVWQNEVVRGVGGRRQEYRPIVSRLTNGTAPLAVAEAFREQFGLTTLYLADLDAIIERRPHHDLYVALAQRGFRVWVDGGVHSADEAAAVAGSGAETVIIGLESWPDPHTLSNLISACGAERLLFSVDLRNGVPMASAAWSDMGAADIAENAINAGFRRLLVLDLSDVGSNTGGRTDDLLRALRSRAPHIELVAGGGVRGPADLSRLARLNVDAVLVASALHDGRLTAEDLVAWQ